MKNLFKIMTTGFLVAGSVSVITSALIAQELPAQGPIPFSVYDKNNDGFLSTKEFYDVREKRAEEKIAAGMPMKNAENTPDFSFYDLNGDGKLSETELNRGQNTQMMNNKGNKGMSQRANMPTFESFDVNGDGVITPAELDQVRAKRMEEKATEGKMMKNAGNQSAFSDMDTNNDGAINKDEFLLNQKKMK
jgi:Ca2+-binding EF-hand superfamily protein